MTNNKDNTQESPLPEEIQKFINEAGDKYAFQVPYDGSNKFYDEPAWKAWRDGANAMYRHLQADKPKGMSWVKASERLPPLMKKVCGKANDRPAVVENTNISLGFVTANGHLERVANIEWLDESQSPDLESADIADLKIEIEGYKEMHEDHKSLVRDIDFILEGKGAAKQASLCDLVGPIQVLKDYRDAYKEMAGKQILLLESANKEIGELKEENKHLIIANRTAIEVGSDMLAAANKEIERLKEEARIAKANESSYKEWLEKNKEEAKDIGQSALDMINAMKDYDKLYHKGGNLSPLLQQGEVVKKCKEAFMAILNKYKQ